MKIEGQTAVITGGCFGVGPDTAKYLVKMGARVVLLDIYEDVGKQLVKELGPSHVHYIKTDFTKEQSIKAAYEKAVTIYTPPRIYVHTAGIPHTEMILNGDSLHSTKDFLQVITYNLIGTFLCSKFAANALRHLPVEGQERGVIINLTSIVAAEGGAGWVAYAASKGGVRAMTLPMARELGKLKIRVITIQTGIIATSITTGKMTKEVYKYLESQIAIGRYGTTEDYGKLVGAIVTNDYLNGTTINLDGGLHLPHM